MPRQRAEQTQVNFSAGFHTEATGLTYPDNSVQDIDNVDLELDGTARRRLGIAEEPLGESIPSTTAGTDLAVEHHIWKTPRSQDEFDLIVIQIGPELIIRRWDNDTISSLTDAVAVVPNAGTSIDTSTFAFDSATAAELRTSFLVSASGYGRLWLASPHHLPFYIELDDAGNYSTNLVGEGNQSAVGQFPIFSRMQIRDLNVIEDGINSDFRPPTMTQEHWYNLANAGWWPTTAHVEAYFVANGEYPSRSEQWILGKDATDNFDSALLRKQDFGATDAPRGRILIDPLTQSRDDRISIPASFGLGASATFAGAEDTPAIHGGAFRAIAFFAGRLWLSGDVNPASPNGVYYSQVIKQTRQAGLFRSQNDPTSEHFPDPLATDGGVIYIPEAENIVSITPFGAGIVVLATNGVWFIRGGDAGFSANEFSVDKISSVGVDSPRSVVNADEGVFFWSGASIQFLSFADGITPSVTDIAKERINSYLVGIPEEGRKMARGSYDPFGKKLYWTFYRKTDYTGLPDYQSFSNEILKFDTRLNAFTKYSYNADETNNEAVVTILPNHRPFEDLRSRNNVKMMVMTTNAGTGDIDALFGEFSSTDFTDFESTNFLLTEDEAEAFLITGDFHLGDLQRFKQAIYLHSYFNKTETGFTDPGDGDPWKFTNPSGCLVTARWDWHITVTGGRWSNPQQAYRHRRPYSPSSLSDPFDDGVSVVYTRLKIRGKGHALALKYESEAGKDFQLIGFSVPIVVNAV